MNPAFLRSPGGNYLEGRTIATRFDWKKTISDISQRPGHMDDAWRYWSSDGMGLLELLEWCEDLHMEPVLGASMRGYSLSAERVAPGADLEPYVKDAIDEIEYVTGGAGTTWGARRANDGHPAPFKLEYVEVGNEDQFDRQTGSYDGRFRAILRCHQGEVSQAECDRHHPGDTRTPDVIDEHYVTAARKTRWHLTPTITTPARAPARRFSWANGPRECPGAPTPNMAAPWATRPG